MKRIIKKKLKPRGRPPLKEMEKLSKVVTVKFTRSGYTKLYNNSRRANLTVAEFLRKAAFKSKIVPRHSERDNNTIRNLIGIANNLNQLTRLAHKSGFTNVYKQISELMSKFRDIMQHYKYD